MLPSICVFCGANPGTRPVYVEVARAFGSALATSGRRLVYGGGGTGIMGAVADGALAAGGDVVGVMPRHLVDREAAHRGVPDLRIVETMHERKAMMADLADGFAVLPGGLGTMEELFEVWTWGQLGLHGKPYGLLDTGGFFAPLVAFLRHATAEGFVRAGHLDALAVDDDPVRLLAKLDAGGR
jgi:uncharacterized protein (TIGR00730 family)